MFLKNKYLYLVFSDFVNIFDSLKLKFFNISFYYPVMDQIMNDFHIKVNNDMYLSHGSYCSLKIPWIDVFILLDHNDHQLQLIAKDNYFFPKEIFQESQKVNIQIINKDISIPNIKKYVSFYYGDFNKFNNYIIKSSHNKDKKILFSINLTNIFYKTIVHDIFHHVNLYIDHIYHSININTYLESPFENMKRGELLTCSSIPDSNISLGTIFDKNFYDVHISNHIVPDLIDEKPSMILYPFHLIYSFSKDKIKSFFNIFIL